MFVSTDEKVDCRLSSFFAFTFTLIIFLISLNFILATLDYLSLQRAISIGLDHKLEFCRKIGIRLDFSEALSASHL